MRIRIRNPEWCNPDRRKDPVKLYNVPANEKELEALRLEWSYLRGRADIMWRRTLSRNPGQNCDCSRKLEVKAHADSLAYLDRGTLPFTRWGCLRSINLSCWIRIRIQEGKNDPQK
jgi:hypothetical protein